MTVVTAGPSVLRRLSIDALGEAAERRRGHCCK